jgi:hypothetical protein
MNLSLSCHENGNGNEDKLAEKENDKKYFCYHKKLKKIFSCFVSNEKFSKHPEHVKHKENRITMQKPNE